LARNAHLIELLREALIMTTAAAISADADASVGTKKALKLGLLLGDLMRARLRPPVFNYLTLELSGSF
jgi:hypothetical protein